ncbi:unnamed protein product [Rotaria sp. Silwood2]|nr:unnamed protein product [Rotaria sp. Silwood2]CAF2778811.1 unnamed protein product [Rotaria sp. Silwood2]CAF3275100.1 unnamed protein product [Rotaria sp. Silwood2]CAF3331420.1 unnamed protein product [Rotaria sp. Silwood2]CAF3922879.1 unnamed protein product [Rotaria sp. Silwood2]
MINPQNVMDILGNLISARLTISSTSTNGPKNEEVAVILFKNVQSILNCTSYSFEDEDTLDLDFNIELADDDPPFDNNEDDDENIGDDDKIDDDCNRNDNSRDADYNDERHTTTQIHDELTIGYGQGYILFGTVVDWIDRFSSERELMGDNRRNHHPIIVILQQSYDNDNDLVNDDSHISVHHIAITLNISQGSVDTTEYHQKGYLMSSLKNNDLDMLIFVVKIYRSLKQSKA